MRRRAFTLAETICALLVSSLVVMTISIALASIKSANQRDLDPGLDWYLMLQELESADHQFEIISVSRWDLHLYSRVSHRRYVFKGTTKMYLTCLQAGGGGYMPLIDGVKLREYSFKQLDSQRVLFRMERDNGQKLSGIIKFYPPTESSTGIRATR